MGSRFVTACLILALLGAGVPPCAGLESTSQTRHACCVEGQCPDQLKPAGHSSGHHGPASPATTDACCVLSEQQHQQRASLLAGAGFLNVALSWSTLDGVIDTRPPGRVDLHAAVPPPPRPPLHLLFAVFRV